MPLSGSSGPSIIRVRLFARYAELMGAELLEVPSAGIATASDLLARVRTLPGGHSLGPSLLLAINLKQVGPDAPIRDGDEVALLPPMAGG